jgi:MIP family channel proteins
MQERGSSAYLAELIGTFLLVLWIAMLLSIYQQGTEGLGYVDFTVIGLLHGFLLMMLIATLGGASGAHFNPAVTITLLVLRKIRGADAGIYIVLQLIGAVLGALVCKLLLDDEGNAVNYGATAVSDQFLEGKVLSGFLAELIGTFALMWAIMGTAVNPQGNERTAPAVIGFTLGFAVMVIGPLTGAGLNPARAFGPGLIGDFNGFGDFLVAFCLGPIVGALLAGALYQAIIIRGQHEVGERPIDALDDTIPTA